MAGLGAGDPNVRWRVTALVLGCLLALAGPYVLLTRVSGSSDASQKSAQALVTTPTRPVALSPSRTIRASTPAAGSTTRDSRPTSTSGTGEVTGSDVAAGSPLAEALAFCRLDSLRVQAALGAADVSLSQFDKHIDAMNLLVAGKISYAVATQFWDETRVGAAQNAAEFRRSQQSLDGGPSQCQGLDPALADALPYGQVNQLNQCVAFVSRGTTALTRADAAVTTWQHHIHDMEMLRMGDITPAQATTMWRRNWHTGQRQLTAFEGALKQARAARCSLD